MASSRDTLNGPDWTDIRNVLLELEADYECRIEVTTRVVRLKGAEELRVTVVAHPWLTINGDQRSSVSLSATLDRSGCGLGVAVIFRLLHTLAYELGKSWAQKIQLP